MDENLTEEQQIEQLKRFWKEYGLSIVIGIVLALVIGFGWRYYRQYKIQQSQEASVIYQKVMISAMNGQTKIAEQSANILLKHYSRTPYAALTALYLAKRAVQQNKLDFAVTQLNWAIKHAYSEEFSQIARIRLARVYIAQNKAQIALSTLSHIDDQSFKGLIFDTMGDAYQQLGKTYKAKIAYLSALKNLSDSSVTRPLLQMKLNNLRVK